MNTQDNDLLDKIIKSKKLTHYEKLCVVYLIEIHIDNLKKEVKKCQ